MKKHLVFCLIWFPLILFAQKKNYTDPEFHKHDGFYFSLNLGGSSFSMHEQLDGKPYVFKGTSSSFDMKIGWRVASNLLLHGTILGDMVVAPTINDIKQDNHIGVQNVMTGGGLTFYVMPLNVYLSASIGAGYFKYINTLSLNREVITSNGPSYQLKIGKEFWVSKNWALGIGVAYRITNVDNNSASHEDTLEGKTTSIHLSATFN